MLDDFRPLPVKKPVAARIAPPPSVKEPDTNIEVVEPPDLPHAAEQPAEKPNASKQPKQPKNFKFLKFSFSRRQVMIAGGVAGLIIAGGLIWWFTKPAPHKPKPVAKQETKKEAPKPTTVGSRLSGVQVTPELDKLPVTGVMIENSPDARPQSGLKDAGVVFEAIAEGGITRFLALFQTEQPDYIGPVRSVRPYYLDFLAPFDAGIAHAGGSGPALDQVRSGAFRDLDQFFNPDYYQRVSSRFAPHNLYTSRAQLLDLQNKKGWGSSTFNGFARKAEKPNPAGTAHILDLTISGYLYNVHYEYDSVTNSYKRSEGGQPQTDERSGAQLSPKVVVALVMPQSYDDIYSVYQDIGSGKAIVFQDGVVTDGIWEKPDRNTQLKLGDANGSPLAINPGQTWFTLVNSDGDVSSKP